jgi:hypothetical protein
LLEFSTAFNLFLLLAMGHFVGDFGLQSDKMACEKCPGCGKTLSWQWWLTAHGAIHVFLVAVITGIPLVGLAEWIAHVGIDMGKCRQRLDLRMDQGLHLACKALWAVLASTLASEPGWMPLNGLGANGFSPPPFNDSPLMFPQTERLL